MMPMINTSREDQTYHSYVLRIWRENGSRVPVWRASLQSVQSQETIRFRSPAELCDFLLKEFMAFEGKKGETRGFGNSFRLGKVSERA